MISHWYFLKAFQMMLKIFKHSNHYLEEWDSVKFIGLFFRCLLRRQRGRQSYSVSKSHVKTWKDLLKWWILRKFHNDLWKAIKDNVMFGITTIWLWLSSLLFTSLVIWETIHICENGYNTTQLWSVCEVVYKH